MKTFLQNTISELMQKGTPPSLRLNTKKILCAIFIAIKPKEGFMLSENVRIFDAIQHSIADDALKDKHSRLIPAT
jgi:hypothetical protein